VENPTPQAKKETLRKKFENERLAWTAKIQEMSQKMRDIFKVNDLMVDIYTERQRAVEYHHYLVSVFKAVNRTYTKKWADRYQYYSYKSQIRFPNERTKELQIQSEMGEISETREELDNHIKFISQTISTIDNLIYGIKYKVEIEQISRGK